MKFRNIDIYRSNDFATEKLSKSELQEILSALNSCNFSRRIALPENHAYQQPDDLKDDLCHTTARKYASINKNLIQVSGYVITFFPKAAKLIAHSVV
ncbi:hypothetical protein PI95_005830 [Hassallia byssoidea VB512170]|uniref:Uncharacterized protein n=1 Tax=Hassallia byssoidea VB512170 TaxID=1304833 RepID=A0A846H614_9CYAN|nr:hypothetical protein [Hassalia byssoidea]NEU72104.1 hypothetical protein [Hassalia byssoidea VB512170]